MLVGISEAIRLILYLYNNNNENKIIVQQGLGCESLIEGHRALNLAPGVSNQKLINSNSNSNIENKFNDNNKFNE
jgi:hypothetical protein